MNSALLLMTTAYVLSADPCPTICEPATPHIGLFAKFRARLHSPCEPCAPAIMAPAVLSCDPCQPGLLAKLKSRFSHKPTMVVVPLSTCGSPCGIVPEPTACSLPPLPSAAPVISPEAAKPMPEKEPAKAPKEMPKPKDEPKKPVEKVESSAGIVIPSVVLPAGVGKF
ncbi:MAG: hypothetical protein ACRC8S_15430 [Fimbriiglobus sp.]